MARKASLHRRNLAKAMNWEDGVASNGNHRGGFTKNPADAFEEITAGMGEGRKSKLRRALAVGS
jgi:hypothetical protein